MFEEMVLCHTEDSLNTTNTPPTIKPLPPKKRRGHASKHGNIPTPNNKSRQKRQTRRRGHITPKYEKMLTRSLRRKYEQQLCIMLEQPQQSQQSQQSQQQQQQQPPDISKDKPSIQEEDETQNSLTFNIESLLSKRH
jgi:hypothetical protein